MRGRILLGAARNDTISLEIKTALSRWYVKTHKSVSKGCLFDLVVKSRLSKQVALWRFKKLLRSPDQKPKPRRSRKDCAKFFEFLKNLEQRISKNCQRLFFNKLLICKMLWEMTRKILATDNFCHLLNEHTRQNTTKLIRDSSLIKATNQNLITRLKKGVFGQISTTFNLLRQNCILAKFQAKFSTKIKNKILQNLTTLQESTYNCLVQRALTRLQKWSRVIDRQKSILIEENRAKTEVIRGKMRFVIQTLRDRESRYAGMAYNGMKGYRILVGD
jgi:hypothetical protein